MTNEEIIVGHRVLVQCRPAEKEHALIKGITSDDAGKMLVIVKLSDGKLTTIEPSYILKDFDA